MGLIQDYVHKPRGIISKAESINDKIFRDKAKELIDGQVKILPTIDTDPETVQTDKVKDVVFDSNFYGKPLCVIITPKKAEIPVFSHNDIEVIKLKKKK